MYALIIAAVTQLIQQLPGLIAEAERTGELTADEAAQRRAEMVAAFASPAWQSDPPADTTPNASADDIGGEG